MYTAEDFIGALTQHIPEKSFQTVRYFGYYSNRNRGMRRKQGLASSVGDTISPPIVDEIEIIDVSAYNPPKIPSKTWRECIKKIYEVDPCRCPRCNGEMRIISFITQPEIIYHILDHLDLWKKDSSRAPPPTPDELLYEPCLDDLPMYEEAVIMAN